MNYNERLMPCPFCGGKANMITIANGSTHHDVSFTFGIECSECGTCLPWAHELRATLEDGELEITKDERDKAVEEWNRRIQKKKKRGRMMERPRKNITATIQPRKATDKGGWLCMPLADNIPNGKKGWRKIHCPICGDMCWKRPEDEALILYNGLDGAACTRCALKMGGDAS